MAAISDRGFQRNISSRESARRAPVIFLQIFNIQCVIKEIRHVHLEREDVVPELTLDKLDFLVDIKHQYGGDEPSMMLDF